jgi:hypothetical protein
MAERLPAELVAAHPLQPHRPAAGRRPRQQRGIEGNVVGAVMAVAARAFRMNAVNLVRRQLERHDEVAAQRENALAVGPHRHLAAGKLRDRA